MNKPFIIGLCSGAIGMDLINCHLYRLGSIVHWIDIGALLLWPVMLWALFGLLKVRLIETNMREWIERQEKVWEERRRIS